MWISGMWNMCNVMQYQTISKGLELCLEYFDKNMGSSLYKYFGRLYGKFRPLKQGFAAQGCLRLVDER